MFEKISFKMIKLIYLFWIEMNRIGEPKNKNQIDCLRKQYLKFVWKGVRLKKASCFRFSREVTDYSCGFDEKDTSGSFLMFCFRDSCWSTWVRDSAIGLLSLSSNQLGYCFFLTAPLAALKNVKRKKHLKPRSVLESCFWHLWSLFFFPFDGHSLLFSYWTLRWERLISALIEWHVPLLAFWNWNYNIIHFTFQSFELRVSIFKFQVLSK